MIKYLKKKIIYWLASSLLPVVNEREIISFHKEKVYVDKKELSVQELNNLRTEADVISQMRLWNIIVNDLNKKTQDKIYLESKDILDLLVGKTILYTLDVQNRFINKLKH